MSERGREVVGEWREVKDREGVRWRKYPDSSLICSTITPSELLWKSFRAALICAGCYNVSAPVSSSFTIVNPFYSHEDFLRRNLIIRRHKSLLKLHYCEEKSKIRIVNFSLSLLSLSFSLVQTWR